MTLAVLQPATRPGFAGDSISGTPSLVEQFIAKQQSLSAVEKFSFEHEYSGLPAQERYYRDLIPATAPRDGEQYAFEVDLDACSGCKACVAGCHNLNGLDETETWRDVGLLVGGAAETSVMQHVTTACHHCLDPACMSGCPVKAYEKDPVTGIVKHLDDQCIGCQYCILKCPYDVPKYNKQKGIVRKCDMCSDRLSSGEAPACVQSCPNGAIKIRIVAREQVMSESAASRLVAGTVKSDYTKPTTQFKTSREQLNQALPADLNRFHPEHAHAALVVMLVLTQLSVGTFLVGQAIDWLGATAVIATFRPLHTLIALGIGLAALGASTMHLGRPFYAFRAFLGLRTSWLSREIIAFGGFAGLATAYTGVIWLLPGVLSDSLLSLLRTGVIAMGLIGVVCSIMIYHDTRRHFWHIRRTGPKFLLTTLLLGLSTSLAIAAIASLTGARTALDAWTFPACAALITLTIGKLAYGARVFRHLRSPLNSAMHRSARLLVGPLRSPLIARYALGLAGGVLLPLVAMFTLGGANLVVPVILLFLSGILMLAGELFERYLFFTAVVAHKMPGGL